MFENEEKQLSEIKSELDKISIPSEKLSNAIHNGVLKAESEVKERRKKRQKSLWGVVVAAILLLTFVTSVRVSPAFANAVASVPGLGVIVELVQYNKGIQGIVDNDYYQSIQASQTKDNITLTIDGVIIDETGIVLSYVLEAPYSIKEMSYENVEIFNDGSEIKDRSMSYNFPDQKNENRKEDLLTFNFTEKRSFDSPDFELKVQLENANETTFSIPFTIPQEVKLGKVYALNQEVVIDKQKMTIEDVTIYPLRVAVNITIDESNTMEILNFEDMRIEDEKGEVWSSIQDGVSGFGFGEKKRTFYLQSNYFEQPKQLFFKFNEIQALPKEEAFLLIDLEKKEILSGPSKSKLEVIEITSNWVEVRLPKLDKEFNHSMFLDVESLGGETVESNLQSTRSDDEYYYSNIQFDNNPYQNPLKFNFSAYPNYIKGDISIELKK